MRAYYINVAKRTERRAAMEARFLTLGIDAQRIEAITLADVTDEQRRRFCNPQAHRWKSDGELCCSLSHQKASRTFLQTDEEFALILEDDAVLSPALPRFLHWFDNNPLAIDMLRIETDNARMRLSARPDLEPAGYGVHRLFSAAGGAAAYIVSRRAARRIIAGNEVNLSQTDQALFNPRKALSQELAVRQLRPALAIQEDRIPALDQRNRLQSSDLEGFRSRRQELDVQNFWRRSVYNVYDFIDREFVGGAQKFWNWSIKGVRKVEVPFKPD